MHVRYHMLKEGKQLGLKINETKTKYIIVFTQNHRTDFSKVNDYTFKRVGNFKYLGADINEDTYKATEKLKYDSSQQTCVTMD